MSQVAHMAAKLERTPVIWFWRGFYLAYGRLDPPTEDMKITELGIRLLANGQDYAYGLSKPHFRINRFEAQAAMDRMGGIAKNLKPAHSIIAID